MTKENLGIGSTKLTRRELLTLAGGVAAVGLAAFNTPEAQAAPAQPVVTRNFPSSIDLRFRVPSSFSPEGDSNSVKNFLIPKGPGVEAPEGVYLHPKTERDGVWSYDQSWGVRSNPRVVWRSHAGVEGQLWLRQGKEPQDIAFAVATLPNYTDSQGRFSDFSERPNAFQIDTHCETEVWVINPDSGRPIENNGNPVKIRTSDAGDVLFRIARQGRIAIAFHIPVDVANETFIEKAYRDSNYQINEMDLGPYMVR